MHSWAIPPPFLALGAWAKISAALLNFRMIASLLLSSVGLGIQAYTLARWVSTCGSRLSAMA